MKFPEGLSAYLDALFQVAHRGFFAVEIDTKPNSLIDGTVLVRFCSVMVSELFAHISHSRFFLLCFSFYLVKPILRLLNCLPCISSYALFLI